MARQRLDVVLVGRGLASTREQARGLIMGGAVRVEGRPASKPGLLVHEQSGIEVAATPRFVGRGGLKLERALDAFGIEVSGCAALDVGASTGGFTDCLLQRGAVRVYAVDVGYGQLDYRLRTDPRVVVRERVNARYPLQLPEPVDLATVDVSFISLEMVLPSITAELRPGGRIVALVKPQFEVGRGKVGKGGVVRDAALHAEVLSRIVNWSVDHQLRILGLTPSPLLGDAGNREFLLGLKRQ
ncbi:MAG: TlyA family RNA methyltransferase [Dehalococcoidia bacterium]|nr:TlyA family RNA methyltransferase [Dehalococcoidia bacterium]